MFPLQKGHSPPPSNRSAAGPENATHYEEKLATLQARTHTHEKKKYLQKNQSPTSYYNTVANRGYERAIVVTATA